MDESISAGLAPKERTVQAARALFTENGFSATSLQMIADRVGVTKAAIYHQYPTKDAILRAVLAPALERMARIVDSADAASTETEAFESAVNGLVELVLEHGDIAGMIRRDAKVAAELATDREFVTVTGRLDGRLIGDKPTEEARAALVMAGGGLMMAGVDPTRDQIDTATFKRVLAKSVRRVLEPYRPVE